MGLMSTLAKLAIGYAAARGVDKMSGGGGLGALLGGGAQIDSGNPTAAMQAKAAEALDGKLPPDGAMGEMMQQLQAAMGGAGGAGNPLAGMMSGMAGGLSGGANPLAGMMEKLQGAAPDLAGMVGSGPEGKGLLSGLGGGGTGLAGMLAAAGGMMAGAQGQGASAMLDAIGADTAPEAEATAALMLRAMIMAAKSDGGIDAEEQARLMDTIGDAEADDMAFVEAALAAPVDAQALAADVPASQATQVYAASLMTIRVDTEAEAHYLDSLARALDLDAPTVNTLHLQMGMKPLYR